MAVKRTNNNSSNGTSFTGLLFIVFLVLKLTKVIDWSWCWITAPLWGVVAIVLAVFIGIFIYHAIKGDVRSWLS